MSMQSTPTKEKSKVLVKKELVEKPLPSTPPRVKDRTERLPPWEGSPIEATDKPSVGTPREPHPTDKSFSASPSPSKRKRGDDSSSTPTRKPGSGLTVGSKWETWEDQVLFRPFLERSLPTNEWNVLLAEINAGRDADQPRTMKALKCRWDALRAKALK